MSFGVLAAPEMGAAAAIAMSFLVFAGAAQFASVGIMAAGGSLASAASAGLLINSRFLPMGLAVAPALHGGPAAPRRREPGDGRRVVGDRQPRRRHVRPPDDARRDDPAGDRLVGRDDHRRARRPLLGDPATLGLDAMFPAFYLALLAEEMSDRAALSSALLGAAIALASCRSRRPGIPVVAASARRPARARGRS